MSDRQKSAKAKKQNHLEGLIDAREGRVSRLDQFEVIELFIEQHHPFLNANSIDFCLPYPVNGN